METARVLSFIKNKNEDVIFMVLTNFNGANSVESDGNLKFLQWFQNPGRYPQLKD